MKSDNIPGNSRNNASPDNDKTSAYDNVIEIGSVGIEGNGNNGASTLRVLKKKHANDMQVKKANTRRPML